MRRMTGCDSLNGRAGIPIAALAAAVAMATAAAAQPAIPPATPEAAARAHLAADLLISAAQVGDLFTDISTGAEPLVRHLRSGLICGFGDIPAQWAIDRLVVFPSGAPRGDDVGCAIHVRGFTVSMDVTRTPNAPALDEVTAAYAKTVLDAHPGAKPYTGSSIEPRGLPADFPAFRTIRYVFQENGQSLFSRLSVSVVGDWVIEERVTGPLEDATFGDLLAGGEMLVAIDSVHGGDLLKKR